MSAVVALRGPDVDGSRKTTFVGMVMALGSWSMLFGALFFAYAILRLRAGTWPPMGVEPLPRLLPSFNTLVLLASSVVLAHGLRPASESRIGALASSLRATLALGSLFLLLQLAVWIPLWQSGFRIDSGVYGSVFYFLTVFHALHVLAGLVALAVLLPGARAGRWRSGAQGRVKATALFWHFVDAVWVVMFVAVYLL